MVDSCISGYSGSILAYGGTGSDEDSNKNSINTYNRESSLVFVDLAGSERASATKGKNYLRFEESKSYLSGNSKLTIITTISSDGNSDDTLNSLRFAARASQITIKAIITRSVDYESLYIQSINIIDDLKSKVLSYENIISDHSNKITSQDDMIDKLKEFNERKEEILSDIIEKDNKIDSLEHDVQSANSSIVQLTNVLEKLEIELQESIPITKFKEMESLFLETTTNLSNRVLQLENVNNSRQITPTSSQNNNSQRANGSLNVTANRLTRIEPGGRIRR
eukprot:gene17193-22713_t